MRRRALLAASMPSGETIELPIRLYEGFNENVDAIIAYIRSLDTDGDGYVGSSENEKSLKDIIHINDVLYPRAVWWYDEDEIIGGICFHLADDSYEGDILGFYLYSDGTFYINWD